MGNSEEEISEDGVFWEGTRAELEAWKEHKREKAIAFVQRGYSVEWSPDGAPRMSVYLPQRHYAREPELRAEVQAYRDPSHFGIDGGRISKLLIRRTRVDILAQAIGAPYETVEVFYNYDRGPDLDRLATDALARRLFDDVVRELN